MNDLPETWIEVDLDAVKANYAAITGKLQGNSRCLAVIKADAYGLGAVEIAKTLEKAGCEAFAVTTVSEGLVLRDHGIRGMLLILGPSVPEEWRLAVMADLCLTMASTEAVEKLEKICAELGRAVAVHLKIETGMGRTGFSFGELDELAQILRSAQYIKAEGIYTHFARAAQKDHAYTRKQYEFFCQAVDKMATQGISPQWRHVCNSAAYLDYPQWHHDFVRIGTLLIGHYPGPGFQRELCLRDPWTAKSRISYLRKVPKGTCVGYQSIYKTNSATELAVIPVGYADGFGVEPHFTPQGFIDLMKIIIKNVAAYFGVYLGRERVRIKGKTIGVAGKVGMQLTVLDVGIGLCQVGDEVEIPLRRTLANPRLIRQYIETGQVVKERRIQEEVRMAAQASPQ